ncbi:MAG TPA: ATP-binding protein [bacterium]|nr:ATP-binding protein [bacterium]HPJ72634.1 ATP-binding protein [bacterium]HPQ66078.1 ATP-binding protein [bacterium]
MPPREKHIRAEASLSQLETVVDSIIGFAAECGLPREALDEIHLAVDEACTNIINYAYPAGVPGPLEAVCRYDEAGGFSVVLRDRGKPFDPTSIPSPRLDQDLEHRPIGGLGIFLMKQMMGDLRYRRRPDGINELTMSKLPPCR